MMPEFYVFSDGDHVRLICKGGYRDVPEGTLGVVTESKPLWEGAKTIKVDFEGRRTRLMPWRIEPMGGPW